MNSDRYQHKASVTVYAPAERVYELVSDITRMGEWSPVCTGGQWLDDEHRTFTGANATDGREWETRCRVDVAEPGREFTFTNCGFDGTRELVRWSYTFAPAGEGTEVTESWQVLPDYAPFMAEVAPHLDVEQYLDGVVPKTQAGMAETLERLKAAAES